jgi:pyruvate,water dikinase
VSGAVDPDTYVVAKDGPRLASARVGHQPFMIRQGADGEDERIDLDGATGAHRVLSDEEVLELARLGARVEEHYDEPQDMEWAYRKSDLYLLQSRPITTLGPSTAWASFAPSS